MSETIASRAILIFCTEPRMWMFLEYTSDRCEWMSDEANEHSRVGKDDTCPASVLDRELDFPTFSRYTSCTMSAAPMNDGSYRKVTYRLHVPDGLHVMS